MHQIRFRPGLRPGPRWGSSRRSPRPPSRLRRGHPLPIPHPSTPSASRSRRLQRLVLGAFGASFPKPPPKFFSGYGPAWARAPLAFEKFFRYTLKQVIWFGLLWYVLFQTLNLALFVQPYSLWNDIITGYNGVCAKVNVVFTTRRYALARSLLSSGVRPSVCPSRSCIVSRRLKILSNIFLDPEAPSF